jgi:hypothetical protein
MYITFHSVVISLINVRIIVKLLKSKPAIAGVITVSVDRADKYLLIVSEGD